MIKVLFLRQYCVFGGFVSEAIGFRLTIFIFVLLSLICLVGLCL
jgi:predicted MFS family arabinose efflux permease